MPETVKVFNMPVGYEKIDGHAYPTRALQAEAYDDIRIYGTLGKPGAFLYGKKKAPIAILAWPLDKHVITQLFGANPQIYAKFGLKGHNGIDLRTRFVDSPLGHRYVTAAAPGWCEVRIKTGSGYGDHIRIHHFDGSLTIYGHLSKIKVYQGQIVTILQTIGLSGNTGFSSGPHLHFEYRPPNPNINNGYAGAINPLPFMPPPSKV